MGLDFFPGALILVAVVPDPRDLEIARLLGWYRIPLRFAPKVIEVDYLAFYQTAAFGQEHRWKIEYVSRVKGNELMRRIELFRNEPDHPRANEEYYKISIGPLQHLEHPIQAGQWRRITFLFTTSELLLAAWKINDLVIHSQEREILWNSLRERALRSGKYKPEELPEIALEPELLVMLGELSKIRDQKKPYEWE